MRAHAHGGAGQGGYFLSNPCHVKTAYRYGEKAFAQVIEDSGHKSFRGQIICRADNQSIRTLEDCKGKRLIAVDLTSAGGYLYPMGQFYDSDLPQVLGDTEKLKQVVMNLVMNARQSISQAGQITVSTRHDSRNHKIAIAVEDTGSGIPPHVITRIFDPFFTTKPTGQGTGLGLSVSYGIVKEHGGEITVDSEPEKGSLFSVTLPDYSCLLTSFIQNGSLGIPALTFIRPIGMITSYGRRKYR